MTVIAWDGKTLAADKRSCNSSLVSTVTKIYRLYDSLYGFAGNSDVAQEMLAWFKSGAKPEDYPKPQRDKDDWVGTLVISPGPTIKKYERTPYPLIHEVGYYSIGSGRDFAMAAMYMGKTAQEAVEIASALTCDCGNGVDTLTL